MTKRKEAGGKSRRTFLRSAALCGTLAVARPGLAQNSTASCPADGVGPDGIPESGGTLVPVGEIRRGDDGVLRATILVEDELRSLWVIKPNTVSQPGYRAVTCREKQAMRYFAGALDGKRVWPIAKGVPGPGPTLRARIGDQVQITLLNHVDLKNFPDTLDLAERGMSAGCDASATLTGAEGERSRQEVYPLGDEMPNCFHGSSSANLHFHGFHVSPSATADNVLVQVRPSPRDPKTNRPLVTEAAVRKAFQELFAAAAHGKYPKKWEDLPLEFRRMQEQWVKAYDKQMPAAHLWDANQQAIQSGQWPPYFVGAYANSFKITEAGKAASEDVPAAKAAQSPGTHWYHSHKHGSTALNSFNGMAGAFIVEGDYDDKLRAFYGGSRLEEKVLVIQQFAPSLNLLNAPAPGGLRLATAFDPLMFVNGQPKPVIEMRPGQVQLWRMLNACGQETILMSAIEPATAAPPGAPPPGTAPANVPPAAAAPADPAKQFEWRQTAQDGIQFSWGNFSAPKNRNRLVTFSPANRADLLVKAPVTPGRYDVRISQQPFPGTRRSSTLMSIEVKGEAVTPPMGFPEKESDFPALPAHLADIDGKKITLRREVTFNTQSFNGGGQPGSGLLGRGDFPRIMPSKHTINGVPFESDVISQVMVEGTEEEWTLLNTTPIPIGRANGQPVLDPRGRVQPVGAFSHPFHIHINPFQVVEIFDPVTMDKPEVLENGFRWHDTIGVPSAFNYFSDGKTPRTDAAGKQVYVPGYVKIRTRFDDFTGMFVFHCHILAHEDRGMMQLVQVVSGHTTAGHHH